MSSESRNGSNLIYILQQAYTEGFNDGSACKSGRELTGTRKELVGMHFTKSLILRLAIDGEEEKA